MVSLSGKLLTCRMIGLSWELTIHSSRRHFSSVKHFSQNLYIHIEINIMDVDHSKTRIIDNSHCFEVGISSWSKTETSIRCRYDHPETGRFSPHGSSELPLHDLQPLIEVAAENDLLRKV